MSTYFLSDNDVQCVCQLLKFNIFLTLRFTCMIISMKKGLQTIPSLQKLMIINEVILMTKCWAVELQRTSVNDLKMLFYQKKNNIVA